MQQSEYAPLRHFAVFNGTNNKAAFHEFYRFGGEDAKPLWSGTPYAEWHELMPYIAEVTALPQFIRWTESEADEDWGMIASSPYAPDIVFGHFRSLTQVWLPNGNHVFFRFYDPRFSLPVAQHCNEEQRALLMGPCVQWCSKQVTVSHSERSDTFSEPPFPWWTVPESVMAALNTDSGVLKHNLLKDLNEHRPDIVQAYPEAVLSHKAQQFVERCQGEEAWLLRRFIEQLVQEQQRLEGIL